MQIPLLGMQAKDWRKERPINIHTCYVEQHSSVNLNTRTLSLVERADTCISKLFNSSIRPYSSSSPPLVPLGPWWWSPCPSSHHPCYLALTPCHLLSWPPCPPSYLTPSFLVSRFPPRVGGWSFLYNTQRGLCYGSYSHVRSRFYRRWLHWTGERMG